MEVDKGSSARRRLYCRSHTPSQLDVISTMTYSDDGVENLYLVQGYQESHGSRETSSKY